MYTAGMDEASDVPDELSIREARNRFGLVTAKAQHLRGVTFLTNHGKRVAAVVSVEDAQAILDARKSEG